MKGSKLLGSLVRSAAKGNYRPERCLGALAMEKGWENPFFGFLSLDRSQYDLGGKHAAS